MWTGSQTAHSPNFSESVVASVLKLLILQISNRSLLLTPVTANSGGRRLFGIPQQYELRPELKDGQALDSPALLARFVKQCIQNDGLSGEIVFCLENDHIVCAEYQHLPCKPQNLPMFAKLEAETVLSEGTDGYIVQNCEYGFLNELTGKFTSTLFAVRGTIIAALRKAFLAEGLQIYRAVPPIAGLIYAAKVVAANHKMEAAILDLDFQRTRLLILHNGLPVFSHSFEGVFDDIVDIVQEDRACSYEEAVKIARSLSLGETGSLSITGESMRRITTLLNASIEEAVRNLRMVLSSERMELTGIILCGALASLSNYRAYWDAQGLDVPLKSISELPEATKVLPLPTSETLQAGYPADAFFTFNGILQAGKKDNLDFITLVQKKSDAGFIKMVLLIGISAAAAILMAVEPIKYISQKNQLALDQQLLANPAFSQVQTLHDKEVSLQKQLKALEADRTLLPFGKSTAEEIFNQLDSQIFKEVTSVSSCSIDNTTGQIALTFTTSNYEKYLELRHSIEQNGYFTVSIPFSVSIQANSSCICSFTLTPAKFTSWKTSSTGGSN